MLGELFLVASILFIMAYAAKNALIFHFGKEVEGKLITQDEQIYSRYSNRVSMSGFGMLYVLWNALAYTKVLGYHFDTDTGQRIWGKTRVPTDYSYNMQQLDAVKVRYFPKFPAFNQLSDAADFRFREITLFVGLLIVYLFVKVLFSLALNGELHGS